MWCKTVLTAVLLWRDAMILLKETGEVVTVVNSYQMADLVDLHVGISEELAGTFNFQLVEVCQWALCSTLAKKS